MPALTVSREMPFAAEKAWSLIDDFSNTWIYHPVVKHSQCTNGTPQGLGARRQCTMYSGGTVEEQVVRHDAEAMTTHIEVVVFGPFPLTHMGVTIEVDALAPDHCAVRYIADFTPKFGPLGWVMGHVAMKPNFKKMLTQLLAGIEAHLESGRVVEEGGTLGETFEQSMLAA
ncbi:MAG: SRPBCC family protein [Bradymonadia bacterium]